MSRAESTLRELLRWDRALCIQLNQGLRYGLVMHALQGVSWLGNGIFWYALMLALLVIHRGEAALPVLHMVFVGVVSTASYKMLKRGTVRPRPFQVMPGIAAGRRRSTHSASPQATRFTRSRSRWWPARTTRTLRSS